MSRPRRATPGATTRQGVHVAFYEGGWPCQVAIEGLHVWSGSFVLLLRPGQWPAVSRGSISLLFALVKGEGRSGRRRMRGCEGWGRHLSSGPATAAKSTFALTHPSNLRETKALPVVNKLPAIRVDSDCGDGKAVDIAILCSVAPQPSRGWRVSADSRPVRCRRRPGDPERAAWLEHAA